MKRWRQKYNILSFICFYRVKNFLKSIKFLVQSISDAGSDIEEQAKGIEHVNNEINSLEKMIQENAKASESTNEVTKKLSELSQTIIKEVNKNKINK